jgi:hypothetical protein
VFDVVQVLKFLTSSHFAISSKVQNLPGHNTINQVPVAATVHWLSASLIEANHRRQQPAHAWYGGFTHIAERS